MLPTRDSVLSAVDAVSAHIDMWMSSTHMGDEPEYPRVEWTLQADAHQLYGNGELIMTVRDGTADLYTLDPFDPNIDEIHRLLRGAGLRPRLTTVQAEEEDALHYQWLFQWVEYEPEESEADNGEEPDQDTGWGEVDQADGEGGD